MKTVKEILSKYSLSKVLWLKIADKEVKILAESGNPSSKLDVSLINFNDKQLEILSHYTWWSIEFWFKELTDKQADILSRCETIHELSLPNLENVSDEQLMKLLQFEWIVINLKDLKLTPQQEILIKSSPKKIINTGIDEERRKEGQRREEEIREREKTQPSNEEYKRQTIRENMQYLEEMWIETNLKNRKLKNRILWLMIGWAIWDALWAPVEHQWYWSFPWVNDYQATARLYEWEWTSDTTMALLLCESLLRKWETDLEDQMDNYLKRHINGYLWTRSYAKSEWNQTRTILEEYYEIKHWAKYVLPWEKDLSWTMQDWNGSLMRIWPVAAFFFNDIRLALQWADDSSKTTHNTKLCRDACTYFTGLIRWALHGEKKEKLLEPYYCPFNNYFKDTYFSPDFKSIIEGDYKHMREDKVSDTRWTWFAFVLNTLRTALRWFYHFDDFRNWMEAVINLWWDSNTNACVYWYLAWAYYWIDAIPDKRKSWLMDYPFIYKFWELLYRHSQWEYFVGQRIQWIKRYDVTRFLQPQEDKLEQAIKDITREHKTPKRRMLYMFPQMATVWEWWQAKTFAISCYQEAKEYYAHPILKERLLKLCDTLMEIQCNDPIEIFWWIDAIELQSCMTIFNEVSNDWVFKDVLNKFFQWQIHVKTLEILQDTKEEFYEDVNEVNDMQKQNKWLNDLMNDCYGYQRKGL